MFVPSEERLEVVSRRMIWFVERNVVCARHLHRHSDPEALLLDGTCELSAFALQPHDGPFKVVAHRGDRVMARAVVRDPLMDLLSRMRTDF